MTSLDEAAAELLRTAVDLGGTITGEPGSGSRSATPRIALQRRLEPCPIRPGS
jgi:hypothetical protein